METWGESMCPSVSTPQLSRRLWVTVMSTITSGFWERIAHFGVWGREKEKPHPLLTSPVSGQGRNRHFDLNISGLQ